MEAWKLVTDEAEICRLDREYQVLGRHLDEALTAANRISSDPFLSGKIKEDAELLSRVIRREAHADAVFPESGDALIEGYYPVLLILTGVENAAKEYRKRGFDGDELLYILSAIPRTIDVHERKYAKCGLNAMYFGWLVIYLRAEMFYEGPFEFQVNQLGGSAYYFLNRSSKEAMAVAAGGRVYHENGRPAKKDAEQEPGDFMPDFIETDDAYTGYPAAEFGEYVSRFPVTLKKSEWELALSPGDDVLNFHIPSGADISPENVLPLMKKGLAVGRERFPERNFKTVVCSSWLLDPSIKRMLGDRSKIVRFGDLFTRFPAESSGKEIFSFVLPVVCKNMPVEEWPDDTHLYRAIKSRYASGGKIFGTNGAILPADRIE